MMLFLFNLKMRIKMKSFLFRLPLNCCGKMWRKKNRKKRILWWCPSQRKTLLSKTFVALLSLSRRRQRNKVSCDSLSDDEKLINFSSANDEQKKEIMSRRQIGFVLDKLFYFFFFSHLTPFARRFSRDDEGASSFKIHIEFRKRYKVESV